MRVERCDIVGENDANGLIEASLSVLKRDIFAMPNYLRPLRLMY